MSHILKDFSDPNLKAYIVETIATEFEGYIAGYGTNNSFGQFLKDKVLKKYFQQVEEQAENSITEQQKQESYKNKQVLKIFESLLGGYYLKDYLTNKSIFYPYNEFKPQIGNKVHFLSDPPLDKLPKGNNKTFSVASSLSLGMSSIIQESQTRTIALNPINPTNTNPSIVAIASLENFASFQSRNARWMNVFLNGIPPIEMSRCTPYLDVKIYFKNYTKRKTKYLNNVFHMRFLKNENDQFVLDDNIGVGSTFPKNDLIKNIDKDINVSYMDIFTSPQTLANGNLNKDSDALGSLSFLNRNKVLEPIAPILSLQNFTIGLDSMGYGPITGRKGSMSLVLHDRSRMSDVAPLVSLSELSSTKMTIEFGWSHPDGDVFKSDNPIGKFLNASRDIFNYYINSTSVRFENNSANIELQISGAGGVEIAKSISPAAGFYSPLNIVGDRIEFILEKIIASKTEKYFTKNPAILTNLKMIATLSSSFFSVIELNDYITILSAAKNPNSSDISILKPIIKALNLLDQSQLNTINDKDSLLSALNTKQNFNDDTLRKNAGRLIRDKFNFQTKSDSLDPFIDNINFYNSKFQSIWRSEDSDKKPKVGQTDGGISLGKLLSMYLASPYMSTLDYSEVQLMFYPINHRAAGARKHTTASIHMPINVVKNIIEEQIKANVNINCLSFCNALFRGFKDIGLPVYELDNLDIMTSSDLNENKKQLAYNQYANLNQKDVSTLTKEEKDSAISSYLKKENEKIGNQRQAQLKQIYKDDNIGPVVESDFCTPQIEILLEVIPVIPPPGSVKYNSNLLYNGEVNTPNTMEQLSDIYKPDQSILRIHVYDKKSTSDIDASFANSLISDSVGKVIAGQSSNTPGHIAYKDKKNKQVNIDYKTALQNIPVADIKSYVKRSYPNITWGANNSVVKSLSMSSNIADRISNIEMVSRQKELRLGSEVKTRFNREQEFIVVPATISVSLIGCPFIARGSDIYIDTGTNTDLDNVFTVIGVTHTIVPGNFTTTLKLSLGTQGLLSNKRQEIANRIKILSEQDG